MVFGVDEVRCGLGCGSGDLVCGKRQKCLDCESDDGLRRAGLENEGRGGTCARLIDSVYLPTCLLVLLSWRSCQPKLTLNV